MTNPCHVDFGVDPAPPNAKESYHTIADVEWFLSRFTAPPWEVSTAEFECNDHCGAKCTVLEAVLEHETGTIRFGGVEHARGI